VASDLLEAADTEMDLPSADALINRTDTLTAARLGGKFGYIRKILPVVFNLIVLFIVLSTFDDL
jgi:hypothetical protein